VDLEIFGSSIWIADLSNLSDLADWGSGSGSGGADMEDFDHTFCSTMLRSIHCLRANALPRLGGNDIGDQMARRPNDQMRPSEASPNAMTWWSDPGNACPHLLAAATFLVERVQCGRGDVRGRIRTGAAGAVYIRGLRGNPKPKGFWDLDREV
jgi:hypothetical protein